jgi:hypothetical protein
LDGRLGGARFDHRNIGPIAFTAVLWTEDALGFGLLLEGRLVLSVGLALGGRLWRRGGRFAHERGDGGGGLWLGGRFALFAGAVGHWFGHHRLVSVRRVGRFTVLRFRPLFV